MNLRKVSWLVGSVALCGLAGCQPGAQGGDENYTVVAEALEVEHAITGVTFGAQQAGNEATKSFDGNDTSSRWSVDGYPAGTTNNPQLSQAWIQYNLGSSKKVTKIRVKWYNGATRTYAARIDVGGTQVWSGNTTMTSGYWEHTLATPATGSSVKLSATGANSNGSNWFGMYETEILGEPGCTVNADCDDGKVCTTDSCNAGACSNTNNTIACDDGNACTVNDVCSNGACVAGSPMDCNDDVSCTVDTCNNGECQHAGGTCCSTAADCDDGNSCTNDSCNAGSCVRTNNTNACDDGNGCTVGEACSGGSCVGGAPRDCDDGNAGTTDSCVAGSCQNQVVSGCQSVALSRSSATASSVEGAYTAGLAIDAGTSGTSRWGSAHGNNADWIYVDMGAAKKVNRVELNWEGAYGKDYDIQIASNASGPWTTLKQARGHTAAGIHNHSGLDGVGRYVRMQGVTRGTVYGYSLYNFVIYGDNSTSCDSGGSGTCATAADCDDANVCTTDSCNAGVCSYSNNNATCNDGNGCTTNDACAGGTCMGSPMSCNDGNACTTDSCSAGACVNTAQPNCCTTASQCNDNNPCTTDSCSGGVCQYSNNTTSCDDGNSCTTGEACSGGSCVNGEPMVCNDSDPNTVDSCSNGVCQYQAVASCQSIALSRSSATGSSTEAAHVAGNAIDASTTTRWASLGTNTESIVVDMGSSKKVNRVQFNWEAAYGKDYDIQVGGSATGPWTTIKQVRGMNAAGIHNHTGLNGAGRYVRMQGVTRGTAWGYSLFDFAVYGDNNPTCNGGTTATCSDGIQNQGETGTDCGGPCAACPTCSDGSQNQGETGVDCGGPCTACGGGGLDCNSAVTAYGGYAGCKGGYTMVVDERFDSAANINIGTNSNSSTSKFVAGTGTWGDNRCIAQKDNLLVESGALKVLIQRENVTLNGYVYHESKNINTTKACSFGELRTRAEYGPYGYVEARMRTPNYSGYIAGLFYFNFGQDVTPATSPPPPDYKAPWLEFDHELQGNLPNDSLVGLITTNKTSYTGCDTFDCTFHSQANKGLGFSHKAAYHVYAIEWTPTALIYYADGAEIHRITKSAIDGDGNANSVYPTEAANLLINFWIFNSSPGFGGTYNLADFPAPGTRNAERELAVDWLRIYTRN